MSEPDSGRVDGSRRMNLLELQARVVRILAEDFVRLARPALNLLREARQGGAKPRRRS